MNEFNLLSAIKLHLQNNIEGQIVHLSKDDDQESPFCLVEIDEIRNNLSVVGQQPGPSPLSKIKFHTICFHDETGIKTSLERSRVINDYLDGQLLILSNGYSAIIKLIGSSVNISKIGEEKTVSHFYESIIRG